MKNGILNKTQSSVERIRNCVILGILVVSFLVVLSIMFFSYRVAYTNLKNKVLELSKSSTEIKAQNINHFFKQNHELLISAAEALDFYLSQGDYEGAKIEELLRKISTSYNKNVHEPMVGVEFSGIYAAVDGVLYQAFHDQSDLPEWYDPTQRQWYQEGLAGNGEVVFGKPYADVYDPNTMNIAVTKLLPDGNTVISIDITTKDIYNLSEDMGVSIIANEEMHNYGFGFLISDEGIVFASGDTYSDWDYNNPSHKMYPIYRELMDCKINESDGQPHYHDIELNGKAGCLFSQMLDNGWTFATVMNTEELKKDMSSLSFILFNCIIAILVITILYCLFISLIYVKSKKLSKKLQETLCIATTDPLTGLANRAAFNLHVSELKKMMKSDKDSPFAVVIMDLNDLKYINDHEGHIEGDKYISKSINLVRSIFPCEIYRVGGDEFVMLLTGELYDKWESLYNKLKQLVEDTSISLLPSANTPSIAIGIAIHKQNDKQAIEDLLREADAKMYSNKLAIKQMRLDNNQKGNS